MPILDASLAFALTMLAVAVAASTALQVAHVLSRYPCTNLQSLLKDFADTELELVLQAGLKRLGDDAVNATHELLDSANRDVRCKAVTDLIDTVKKKNLVRVSTEELLDQLRQSEFGQELFEKIGKEADEIIEAVGKRFETFGQSFTESYRVHSRRWTTGFALVLAFALNVDAIFALRTYLRNDTVREAVISKMDTVASDYETIMKALEKKQNQDGKTSAAEVKKAIGSAKGEIAALRSLGFPIGWSHYPYGGDSNSDTSVAMEGRSKDPTSRGILWFLGVLLTGLLAGLGAPFWFDIVRGIRNLAQKPKG